MKALRQIVMLTQIAVSIAVPLLVFIYLSRWLMHRFSLGTWVMAVGILIGVGSAVSGITRCIKQMLQDADRGKNPPPVSFNDHE